MNPIYTFGGEKFSPPASPSRKNRFSIRSNTTDGNSNKKNYFNSTTAFRAYREVAKDIQTQTRARSADSKRPFSVKKKLSRHDIVNILPPSPELHEPERRSGFRFGQVQHKDLFTHIREEDYNYADDFEEISIPKPTAENDLFDSPSSTHQENKSILKKSSQDEGSLSEYELDEYRDSLKNRNKKHVIWMTDSDDTNSISKSNSSQPSKRNSISNSNENFGDNFTYNRDVFPQSFGGGDYDPFHLIKNDSFRATRPVRRATIGANFDISEIKAILPDTSLTRVYSDEPQPKPGQRIKGYRPANQLHPWNISADPINLPDFPIEVPIPRSIRRSTEIIPGDTNSFSIPSAKSRRNTENGLFGDDLLSKKNKSSRKQSIGAPEVTQEGIMEKNDVSEDNLSENSNHSDEKKEDFTSSTNFETSEPSKKFNHSIPPSPTTSSKHYLQPEKKDEDHPSMFIYLYQSFLNIFSFSSRRSYQPRYQISPAPLLPQQQSPIQTKIVYVRVGDVAPRPMNLWEYLFPCCFSCSIDQVELMQNKTADKSTQTTEVKNERKISFHGSTDTSEFHVVHFAESHSLLVQQPPSNKLPHITEYTNEEDDNCEICGLLSGERQLLKQMNEKFDQLQTFHHHRSFSPKKSSISSSEKKTFLESLQELSKLSKVFDQHLDSLKKSKLLN